MFARKPGKRITLEMYIRNTQVNKKKQKTKNKKQKAFMKKLSSSTESRILFFIKKRREGRNRKQGWGQQRRG